MFVFYQKQDDIISCVDQNGVLNSTCVALLEEHTPKIHYTTPHGLPLVVWVDLLVLGPSNSFEILTLFEFKALFGWVYEAPLPLLYYFSSYILRRSYFLKTLSDESMCGPKWPGKGDMSCFAETSTSKIPHATAHVSPPLGVATS
jgi:hypothetical protein